MRKNSKSEIYLDLSKTTGLRYLDDSCFYDVESLVSITMPSELESLGNYTFINCINLKYAVLNDGLMHIGVFSFGIVDKMGGQLRKVIIPAKVKWIGLGAFSHNPTNIEISSPDGWYYTDDYSNFIYRKGGGKLDNLTSEILYANTLHYYFYKF